MDHKLQGVLPQDVLADIADILGNKGDNQTLRNLSQVCQSLVPLCRRYLFASLHLSPHSIQMTERFSGLLVSNPGIASYLKVFKFQFSLRGVSEHEEHILKVLHERAPLLQSLHLAFTSGNPYIGRLNWNTLRLETRLFLESLIQLPTITNINLLSLDNFPIPLLPMCTGLVNVNLERVTSASSYEVQGIHTRTKIPAPLSLCTDEDSSGALVPLINADAEERMFDFSCLEEVKIGISSSTDLNISKEILNSTIRLDTLELVVRSHLSLNSLGASFMANRRTLRQIKLDITQANNEAHPLCGLNLLLRKLSGGPNSDNPGSVLEQLDLSIYLKTDARCNTDSQDWYGFDRVLTLPCAFPKLRGVDISISWTSSYDGVRDYDLEEVLGQLTEDRFPGLSAAESISFRLFEEHEWE